MNTQALNLQHIFKTYKNTCCLNDININIESGSIIGLLGNNGAGKTTLLRLLTRLQLPSSGIIQYADGIHIGSLIEMPALYPTMSAFQNLEYHIHIASMPQYSSAELLRLVGLPNTHQSVATFSLGMRQRLGLAIALIEKPDLLLLDEPFNGLDPFGVRSIQEIITDLNHDLHTTIIVSSHDLHHLEKIATHFVVLQEGKIISNFRYNKDISVNLEDIYFEHFSDTL